MENEKRLPSNYGNTLFIVFNKLFLLRVSRFFNCISMWQSAWLWCE